MVKISQAQKNILSLQQGKYFDIVVYRKNKDSKVKHVRKFYSQFSSLQCRLCKKKLSSEDATVEHIIPSVIIDASFGYIKPKYGVCCHRCNNTNQVHSHVGTLFSSTNIGQLKTSARYLCDLVRKNNDSIDG